MSCFRTILLVSAVFITIDSFGILKIFGGDYDNGGDDDYDNGAGGGYASGEEEECPEEPVDELQCPEGAIAFNRTPTARNSYTSHWCLQVYVTKEKFVSSYANALCASKKGGVLSAFENAAERDAIYDRAVALFKQNGIAYGSITVDGRKNYECLYNDTQLIAPCTKNGTYRLIDKHTDPTFTFSNWDVNEPFAVDEPNGINIVLEGQYITDACILMYITKPDYPKYDKKFNDMFCGFAVMPTNPGQIYSSFGYVCGWAPKKGKQNTL